MKDAFGREDPGFFLVRHDTPRSLIEAFWKPAADAEGVSVDELLSGAIHGGNTPDGESIELSLDDEIEAIEEQGLWGFATPVGEIHYWCDGGTDRGLLMHFLAHEIGHVLIGDLGDLKEEERRAEDCGRAARLALSAIQGLEN